MKPIPPGGVLLLDAAAGAELLGMTLTRFRFHEDVLKLIKAMPTEVGPRYRQDELEDLRDAIVPTFRNRKLKPGEAARILGVDVRTLSYAARDGYLHRDERGLYDSAEVHALNKKRAGRKTLRVA